MIQYATWTRAITPLFAASKRRTPFRSPTRIFDHLRWAHIGHARIQPSLRDLCDRENAAPNLERVGYSHCIPPGVPSSEIPMRLCIFALLSMRFAQLPQNCSLRRNPVWSRFSCLLFVLIHVHPCSSVFIRVHPCPSVVKPFLVAAWLLCGFALRILINWLRL